ncbi:MAG: hypothetical protein MZV64_27320 [Ignavibacteriales bacterium]|nr:hypothetical protein [Ignavibacteriales bacterium]
MGPQKFGIEILLKKQMIDVPQKAIILLQLDVMEILRRANNGKAGKLIIFSLLRRVLKFYIINSDKINGNNYDKEKPFRFYPGRDINNTYNNRHSGNADYSSFAKGL